jgi:mercuric ion transport protein
MRTSAVLDKTTSIGSLAAAMSCAGCFPALGSFGAAIGLGFLAQYEGFLFHTLIPALALLALIANAVAWYRHRIALRGVVSISGPLIILVALFVLWHSGWGVALFYAGLALMLVGSILDIAHPARPLRCRPGLVETAPR